MRWLGSHGTAAAAVVLVLCGAATGWWMRGLSERAPGSRDEAVTTPSPDSSPMHAPSDARGFEGRPVAEAPDSLEQRTRRLLDQGEFGEARRLLEDHLARFRPRLDHLLLLAECERGEGAHEEEVATLYQARLLAEEPAAERRITELLEQAIDAYSRALIAAHRWGDLDLFYEELITLEPDNGDHYLQLALLRIRLGRLGDAQDPLLRLEHHPDLGERARVLLARIERDNSEARSVDEELALEVADPHYVVRATIDDRREVRLMVDTGAAVTVLRPGLLTSLGYDLRSGERQYFATANGVVAAPIVDIGTLALGAAAIDGLPVAAIDLAGSGEIDGLLGMNFLRRYQFNIDQERRALRLTRGDSQP